MEKAEKVNVAVILKPIGKWIVVGYSGVPQCSTGSTVRLCKALAVGERVRRVVPGDLISARKMDYYLLKADEGAPDAWKMVVNEDDVVGIVEQEPK